MKSLPDRRIAIVGCGIGGLSLAYRLLQKGQKATLFGTLEGSASSCAQGVVANKGLLFYESPLFAAKLSSLSHIQQWLAQLEKASGHRIDQDFSGIDEPYADADDFQDLVVRIYRRKFLACYRAQNLKSERVAAWPFGGTLPLGYLHYPGDGWFDVGASLKALRHVLLQAGVRFLEPRVRALRGHPDAGGLSIVTDDDQIHSFDQVILASGAGTAALLGTLHEKVPKHFLIGGQTIELKVPFAAEKPQTRVRRTLSATWNRESLLLGSTSWKGSDITAEDLAADRQQLIDKATQFFFLDAERVKSWPAVSRVGTRMRFADRMPAVGRWEVPGLGDSLFLFTGFYKNGVQLADLCALDMVSILEGKKPRFEGFSPSRFQ